MFVAQMAAAIAILLLGLVTVVLSLQFPGATTYDVGAGAFPLLVGSGLAVLGGWLVIGVVRERASFAEESFAPTQTKSKVVAIVAILVAYLALTATIGYYPATFVAAGLTVRLLSTYRAGPNLLASAAIVGGLFVVFDLLLGVPLPDGLVF